MCLVIVAVISGSAWSASSSRTDSRTSPTGYSNCVENFYMKNTEYVTENGALRTVHWTKWASLQLWKIRTLFPRNVMQATTSTSNDAVGLQQWSWTSPLKRINWLTDWPSSVLFAVCSSVLSSVLDSRDTPICSCEMEKLSFSLWNGLLMLNIQPSTKQAWIANP